jgi:hypothetical protein
VAATVIFGCSSLQRLPIKVRPALDLSVIEHLPVGKISRSEIVETLGSPDRVVSLRSVPGQEIWEYYEGVGDLKMQRVGLVVDQQTTTLLAATWIPPIGSPMRDLQRMTSRFNTSKFVAKDVGWIARHEYSDDADYTDLGTGISLSYDKERQSVSSISFFVPKTAPIAKTE